MTRFVLGLDLGQAQDFTALVALRRARPPGGGPASYDLLHMERHLGMPYPRVVERVSEVCASPEVRPVEQVTRPTHRPGPQPVVEVEAPAPLLAIDATGVGAAVVDLFVDAKPAAVVTPITITGGAGPRREMVRGAWRHFVPKKDLVSVVATLLQAGRLKVAPGLELADVLRKEFLNFRARISLAANEAFGAWRERDHDDLLLALALAAWLGEYAVDGGLRRGPNYPDLVRRARARRPWGSP